MTPTYLSPESVIGGGERYAGELARAVARWAETELITFGPHPRRIPQSRLHVRILKGHRLVKADPLSQIAPGLVPAILRADVIHCHQFFTPMTDIALVLGRLLGKKVFVTPHGGGSWSIGYHLPIGRLATRFLHVCQYSQDQYA
ncbi:MAG: glycosyltransferase, partial [Acidobacteria bacterium]|nr:glycosyltransferase [Acidobacteriota bacterium]MDW7984767.1 glycosyltransferase family 4 protein [Acidobacteriota bacterium]